MEILVSTLVLSIVLAVVLVVVSRTVVNTTRIDMVYTASNIAKKRIDILKRMPFRDLKNYAEEVDVVVDAQGDRDAQGEYVRNTVITENHLSNSYLTKVKVSVDRIESAAASGNPVVIVTLFADVE